MYNWYLCCVISTYFTSSSGVLNPGIGINSRLVLGKKNITELTWVKHSYCLLVYCEYNFALYSGRGQVKNLNGPKLPTPALIPSLRPLLSQACRSVRCSTAAGFATLKATWWLRLRSVSCEAPSPPTDHLVFLSFR